MHRHLILLLLMMPVLQRCANQTQPTGGPQDEEPPLLLSSVPENGSTNFTDQTIRLAFNEDLQLRNAKNQILITPRTTVDYDIRVRREEVILEFDSLLDPNTTYTINFRESVQDLTEGNPAENLQLAFSTGPQLDSLFISGNIYNMLSGDIPEKATIALYKANDTTDIFKDLPYYFTQSNSEGNFRLSNIKAGPYRVYAYQDYNNNLKVESSSEPYGFLTDTLNLIASDSSIVIPLVNLDIGDFRILSTRPSGPLYIAKYNKAVHRFSYNSTDSLIAQLDPTDPTVVEFYPPFNKLNSDSTQTILTATDSIGQTIIDTLYAHFDYSSRRGAEYNLRADIPPVVVRKPTLSANLIFNKPSQLILSDSVFIKLDSALRIPFDSLSYQWNNNYTQLQLLHTFADSLFSRDSNSDDGARARSRNQRPVIYTGQAAFRSATGDSLDSKQFNLQFSTQQSLSRLILRLDTEESYFIIELLNDGEVYRSFRNPETDVLYFNDLQPGSYEIRAIIDTNNNGVWDPGNIQTLTQPEKIIYYLPQTGERTMEFRANFDWDETFQF